MVSERGFSPPGPSKRSRRDEGGYQRRRGTWRDFRLSYRRYRDNYGRGRERQRRRYMNRRSDWSDFGRGAYSDGPNIQRGGMMSYKQFIQLLEDDILPGDAESRYSTYKLEYIETQKRAYFDIYKDKIWLKDRYHPTNLVTAMERRNKYARYKAERFLLNFQTGRLDLGLPDLTTSSLNRPGHVSDSYLVHEPDAGGKRRRHCWASEKENFQFPAAPNFHPFSTDPCRIQIDTLQAQALIRKLDAEKGIKDNFLSTRESNNPEGMNNRVEFMSRLSPIWGLAYVKGLEGVELLEAVTTYLWHIHGVDYYGMNETAEPKGPLHVIADNNPTDGSDFTGADWEKKLDSFWQERLHRQDPLGIMREIETDAVIEVLGSYVSKLRDNGLEWKYGCGVEGCTKFFVAAEYVYRHLRLKHSDLLMELAAKVREDLYFQNYMKDANAPGGTPVMQQPLWKNKLRRSGNDNMYDVYPGEPMYDENGGEGLLETAGFPLPPLLIPVCGARPFGPFVPASSEVLSGRHGPYQSVRRDPRHIRSYKDLDAMTDEVTVIDYRTLPADLSHTASRMKMNEMTVIDYWTLPADLSHMASRMKINSED